MSKFVFVCAVLLVVSSVNCLPYEVNVDRETGRKFFWYEGENGTTIKAFLEGGPRAASGKAVEDEVHFHLYTKANPTTSQILEPGCDACVDNSNFNPAAPVKFVCHGFWSSHESDLNPLIRDAYFRLGGDTNVIIINWDKLAEAPNYDTAAANTKPVGEFIATFVDYLVNRGLTSYDKVHFAGHSLGSHVGGFVGSSTAGKIARVTAMDPALPLFGAAPDSGRIDPTDADCVDVIHTAGGGLGFQDPRGHMDFYPNGGRSSQPGCGIDPVSTCSHGRAYHYFAESIWHTNGFPGYKCNSWEEYDSGRCSMTEQALMGYPVDKNARGNYYLRTRENPPFGQE